MAALLGMLMGIGGGMLRDVLANNIPAVLRSDPYALAALACAAICVGRACPAFTPDRSGSRWHGRLFGAACHGDLLRLASAWRKTFTG